ncbi:hypothetical protein [Streptomyces sp. NPDC059008]|uniref:hypothetical protein n=1 Tax=Streptomyces sp. NPDC059008 TaxID=3346693 RepID=UPI0036AB5532
MTRARTVQALLGMLAAALLVLQLFAHGARGTEAHAAEPAGTGGHAVSCDHPPVPEEASGHHWTTRNRQDPEGVPTPSAGSDVPSPVAVPAVAAPDVSGAVRHDDAEASGDRSPAALQVFRC